MSGYDAIAQELLDLIGSKKLLTLCEIRLSKHNKSTEKYDKWRKIKRYVHLCTIPIPNITDRNRDV